ncbi:hypothetical protein GSI_12236 [Ganoderma sinense ZZ0214-1]|uniref:Uncharacterized protein n=1 Tax=Ganoderma sinense ZZ0214-1 TaxID=1077348 RepID=A0A2G8RYT5_9APHY|nr:hypothetical protein GSI_12236 [Ganoderma sinense ZZ0214-1]
MITRPCDRILDSSTAPIGAAFVVFAYHNPPYIIFIPLVSRFHAFMSTSTLLTPLIQSLPPLLPRSDSLCDSNGNLSTCDLPLSILDLAFRLSISNFRLTVSSRPRLSYF